MKKDIEFNYYHYIDFDEMYIIEVEIVNHKNNQVAWKLYKATTQKKVVAIAKAQETKLLNRFFRIYNDEKEI